MSPSSPSSTTRSNGPGLLRGTAKRWCLAIIRHRRISIAKLERLSPVYLVLYSRRIFDHPYNAECLRRSIMRQGARSYAQNDHSERS